MDRNNYSYYDPAHHCLSIHRRLLCFEPMALTDNMDFRNIMIDAWEENDSLQTVAELLESDFFEPQSGIDTLPLSYSMMYKTIQLNWINLIIEVIFKASRLEEFALEYGPLICEIAEHSSINDKEYSVYRDLNTGGSIFESAARVYIMSEHNDMLAAGEGRSKTRLATLKRLNHIYDCYEKIGDKIGDRDIILGVSDFGGKTVRASLKEFSINLIKSAE